MTRRVAALTIAAPVSAGAPARARVGRARYGGWSCRGLPGQRTGYGSTLAAAERQAVEELHGDFSGCGTPFLISDAGGGTSWSATMGAYCTGYR